MSVDDASIEEDEDPKHLLAGFSAVLSSALEAFDGCELSAEALAQVLSMSVDRFADAMSDEYKASTTEHARFLLNTQQDFEGSLREVWGPALDAFAVFLAAAHKYGSDFNSANRASAVENDSFCFEVLVGLHARACRTASEVGALLRSGHATGALARWRSLHEIAIAGFLIREGGDELAERYLLHEHVSGYNDMVEYNNHADAIDGQPFSDEEVSQAKLVHDDLIGRFEKPFGQFNGWAADLTKERPTWSALERLAGLDHLRPWYSWSSHGIHATAKGGRQVLIATNGGRALQSGPDTAGLTEPGTAAMASLFQITTSLLTWRPQDVDEVEASMWISVVAILSRLQKAAERQFVDAHDQHEKRVSARRPADSGAN